MIGRTSYQGLESYDRMVSEAGARIHWWVRGRSVKKPLGCSASFLLRCFDLGAPSMRRFFSQKTQARPYVTLACWSCFFPAKKRVNELLLRPPRARQKAALVTPSSLRNRLIFLTSSGQLSKIACSCSR